MRPNRLAIAGLVALYAVLLVAAMPVRAEEDLAAVLARTKEKYGGDALPADGTLLRSSGTMMSSGRSMQGKILREAAWPSYLRVEIDYDDGTRETRLMLDDEGWRDGEPATGPLVLAMKLQSARLSLPMILWWRHDALTDLGPATREDGVAVRRLRIGLDEALALFVEIETSTGKILRSAGVMSMGGAQMSFGAVYSEFRQFGELTWPTHEDQSAMGRGIGWTRIDTLETGLPFSREGVRP